MSQEDDKRLAELNEIMFFLGYGYPKSIGDYPESSSTKIGIELDIKTLVTGYVIRVHIELDEVLSEYISDYFLPMDSDPEINKKILDKRRLLKWNILDYLPFNRKVDFFNDTRKSKENAPSNLHEINNVRMAVAHIFWPELRKTDRSVYRGKNIFSFEGLKIFADDANKAVSFVIEQWHRFA